MVRPEDIRLDQTCFACPEQYDAFVGDELVGYLRLRWGNFTVEHPDCGGYLVLEAQPRGDGCFDDEERDLYLDMARKALAARINGFEERTPDEDGWKAAVAAGETYLGLPDWLAQAKERA